MNFVTCEANLKSLIERAFDAGTIDAVMPEIWAATHHRTTEEIVALIAVVRADRATRLAPNAVPENVGGEGK